MSMSETTLDGVRSLTGLLERLPDGTQSRTLVDKLGLWSGAAHATAAQGQRTKIFPVNLSRLSDAQLSDEIAYWQSEAMRAGELLGLLEGNRARLSLTAKAARSSARGGLRRAHRVAAEAALADGKVLKDPPATQLADEVEENHVVQDLDATLGLLLIAYESTKAYKEACLGGTATLSREISFRQAQLGARIRS
jgi:hypothetical protein